MSRSFKKAPVYAYSFQESEKQDKRKANRSLRRKVNVKLANAELCEEDEDLVLPETREISDRWSFAKDGKKYVDFQMIRSRYGSDEAYVERAWDFCEKNMRK